MFDLKGKRVLDYAGSEGLFGHLFRAHCDEVWVADDDETALTNGRRIYGDALRFVADDYFASTLPQKYFDLMFCRCLVPLVKMEYTAANRAYLERLLGSLTDDGVAYIVLYGNASGRPDAEVRGTMTPGSRLTFRGRSIGTIHVSLRNSEIV